MDRSGWEQTWRTWWGRALLVALCVLLATSQVRVSRDPVSPEVAGVQVVATGIPSDR